MKTYFIVIALLLSSLHFSFAQSKGNFGFNGGRTPLSSFPVVKNGTNMIITDNHIYYVSNTDNYIYDMFQTSPGVWAPSTAALDPYGPAVKAGTNILNNGDDLYFVSAVNSKIYKLKWTAGTGWQSSLVYSIQVPVAGTKLKIKVVGSQIQIFYVGTNGKVCRLFYNGIAWSGGGQLSPIQAVNAIASSALIVTDVHVYFVGTDKKIYDIYWNGSAWTGANVPLLGGADLVKTGTDLVNDDTQTNGNHLYYVNDNSKICEISWTPGPSWAWGVTVASGYNVRVGNQMVCYDNNIFYVNTTDRRVWRLWKSNPNALFTTVAIGPGSSNDTVKFNTSLFVWSNDIIEESTVDTTFKSYHVFYAGSDGKINMLVYDDKHIDFQAFGCYDPCDINQNGSGWDKPAISGDPAPGYHCDEYMIDGINDKEWHFGEIPMTSTVQYIPSGHANIIVKNKHFYYPSSNDKKVYDFQRSVLNPQNKVDFAFAWGDEFGAATLDINKWRKNYTWGNHNMTLCYDVFWNHEANVIQQNGIVSLQAHNATSNPATTPKHWEYTLDVPFGSCEDLRDGSPPDGLLHVNKDYNYTTSEINSEGLRNISMGQYVEGRFKVPRGNRFWSGFWFPYNGEQDINFEFDGNGKSVLMTKYHKPYFFDLGITGYAVGYRYYDDYYTYGFLWKADSVIYYINNERIGALPNYFGLCKDPRPIIFSNELSDANVHAACVPELFPASFDIDYVRTYDPACCQVVQNPTFSHQTAAASIENIVYPNPATDKVTIEYEGFSKVEVYNLQGSKITESTSPTFNIEGFSKGLYLLKIIDINGNAINSKLIKE